MLDLSQEERWLLQACVATDDSVAVAGWEAWAESWRGRSSGGWAAAPDPQLALVVPAYWRLRRAGYCIAEGELAKGLVRSTWSLTATHLGLAMPHVLTLAEEHDVMLIKGAALCASGVPFSHRRISDVDAVVRRLQLPSALATLQALGYAPLYGATFDTVAYRLAQRRDGWNFRHPSGAQLDLHWRFFEVNARDSAADDIVWSHHMHGEIFGKAVRIPPAAFLAVFSTYHASTRGTSRDRLQNFVDLAHLLEETSSRDVLKWAQLAGIETQTGIRLRLMRELGAMKGLSGVEEWTPRFRKPPQRPWEQARSDRRPLGNLAQRRASRFPASRRDEALCVRPRLYRIWEILGRSPAIERWLLAFGPFTQTVRPHHSGMARHFDFTDASEVDVVAGPGWSWTDPSDAGTWTDRADARLFFRIPPGCSGEVRIMLSGTWNRSFHLDGNFSANPRGVIFVDGKESVRYDVWSQLQKNPIVIPFRAHPSRDWVEISIRPSTSPNPRKLPPVYEGWKRSLCVGSVSVLVHAEQSSRL